MIFLPNLLSMMRLPLAFLFLQDNVSYRCLAIFLALITDALDGFLARRYSLSSQVGALLDPLMDKFFVFFLLAVLMQENRLTIWEAAAMACRDFSVMLFGGYLVFKGTLANYQFRSIWCGKLMTFLQFGVLLGLTCQIPIPGYVYGCFIAIGSLALVELYLSEIQTRVSKGN